MSSVEGLLSKQTGYQQRASEKPHAVTLTSAHQERHKPGGTGPYGTVAAHSP